MSSCYSSSCSTNLNILNTFITVLMIKHTSTSSHQRSVILWPSTELCLLISWHLFCSVITHIYTNHILIHRSTAGQESSRLRSIPWAPSACFFGGIHQFSVKEFHLHERGQRQLRNDVMDRNAQLEGQSFARLKYTITWTSHPVLPCKCTQGDECCIYFILSFASRHIHKTVRWSSVNDSLFTHLQCKHYRSTGNSVKRFTTEQAIIQPRVKSIFRAEKKTQLSFEESCTIILG